MAKLSISKSVRKRLKITGSGRTLHRPKGLCHARANKTSKQMGRKKGYRHAKS